MKSVGKALTFAMLTVGFGLAMAPSAMAWDLNITPVVDLTPRVQCPAVETIVQPAVISNGCAAQTLCQPAVVAAPVSDATLLTDTGVGIIHRPTELLNQRVLLAPVCHRRSGGLLGFLGLGLF